MKFGFVAASVGLALTFVAMPLPAHHSTRAAYDASRIVTMLGIVTEVRWINPHVSFFMDVKDATGSTIHWDVELPAPSILVRQGMGRNDLKADDRITVDVWLGKDVSDTGHRAYVRTLALADGRTISGKSVWDDPPLHVTQ